MCVYNAPLGCKTPPQAKKSLMKPTSLLIVLRERYFVAMCMLCV